MNIVDILAKNKNPHAPINNIPSCACMIVAGMPNNTAIIKQNAVITINET